MNFEYKDGLPVKFTYGGLNLDGVMKVQSGGFWLVKVKTEGVFKECNYSPELLKHLRPAEGFWPVPGDVLVWPDGRKNKVSAWLDDVYGVSYYSDHESFAGWYAREELLEMGVKIKGVVDAPSLTEVTKEDAFKMIAEKLGVDSKNVRIKE